MLHELQHIDTNSRCCGGGHITDLYFFIQGQFGKKTAAYGPKATKILARWPNTDVVKWVMTNGKKPPSNATKT